MKKEPREGADRASVEQQLQLNLRQWRERRGISQIGLAEAMNAHGHSWHQATVYKVETSTRSVTASELVALAEILDASVWDLVLPPSRFSKSQLRAWIVDAEQELEKAETHEAELRQRAAAISADRSVVRHTISKLERKLAAWRRMLAEEDRDD